MNSTVICVMRKWMNIVNKMVNAIKIPNWLTKHLRSSSAYWIFSSVKFSDVSKRTATCNSKNVHTFPSLIPASKQSSLHVKERNETPLPSTHSVLPCLFFSSEIKTDAPFYVFEEAYSPFSSDFASNDNDFYLFYLLCIK